ncbi:hypothetical protein ORV05_35245 [Amycolatopsis cynarae]|uniref:DUF222 domain-containing protein n=1 Tax=Amycolatopsis cynarae TaxID=2995223 RepID=A0ABY7B563_9PSEU|nr:hypothetical protein [Amycolatopsis sp. HUAS 11-8]WAL66046.1 hypothetical protein ORV05_35245 [Amycolatopsis sp. HUAS 11-8]
MEVHSDAAVLGTDGFAVPLRLHNLLLALAGRLDDSALSEARELTARARLDEAAELTTGALIAGRLPVRESEQHELGLVLELSRSDATLADHLTVNDAEADNGVLHHFTGDNQPERGIAEALDRTLQVLPDLRAVHAVWRNTPAGSVPGPLPQRVVLVEIGPEGNPPAAAYRVDAALRRAGIRSVVEVTGPGAEPGRYHQQALASAVAVWLSGSPASSAPRRPSPASAGPKSVKGKPGRHVAVDAAPVADEEPEPVAEVPAPAPKAEKTPEAPPAPAAPSKGPGHKFGPRPEPPEARAENTMDLSSAEVAQLRAALAEDPVRGKAIASAAIGSDEVVEIPELDLDDPQLSERDRQLLRELHAELAERERTEAAKVRSNGSARGEDKSTGWVDGFSGA